MPKQDNKSPANISEDRIPTPEELRGKGNPKPMGIFYIVGGSIIVLFGFTAAFFNAEYLYVGSEIDGFSITFFDVVLPVLIWGLVGGFIVFIGIRHLQKACDRGNINDNKHKNSKRRQ